MKLDLSHTAINNIETAFFILFFSFATFLGLESEHSAKRILVRQTPHIHFPDFSVVQGKIPECSVFAAR